MRYGSHPYALGNDQAVMLLKCVLNYTILIRNIVNCSYQT
jgi:hypothetical protein